MYALPHRFPEANATRLLEIGEQIMAVQPGKAEIGWKAVDFALPSTTGDVITLGDVSGRNGTLVMFICNHCPYVTSAIERIVDDACKLTEAGIGIAAICSNDAVTYPSDSFDNMVRFAKVNRFPFPYLHDEDQSVARSYGAACTPDFFGFNASHSLQYRGRLDSGGKQVVKGARRELLEGMLQVANSGRGPERQIPSIGCSIKWKA